jgi:hypothetical protein
MMDEIRLFENTSFLPNHLVEWSSSLIINSTGPTHNRQERQRFALRVPLADVEKSLPSAKLLTPGLPACDKYDRILTFVGD